MGKPNPSKILAKFTNEIKFKACYSHVVVVQSDFICIDDIPKIGLSFMLITGVLDHVEYD